MILVLTSGTFYFLPKNGHTENSDSFYFLKERSVRIAALDVTAVHYLFKAPMRP